MEASNYYVTRTEVHEMLARTFESMGDADSAAVHYDVVARSWEYGDEPFRARAVRAAAESAKLRHSETDAPRAGIRQVAQRR